jgi:hypothetical protein
MNQGTQGYSLMKKTEGRKSRDTVSLSYPTEDRYLCEGKNVNAQLLTVRNEN